MTLLDISEMYQIGVNYTKNLFTCLMTEKFKLVSKLLSFFNVEDACPVANFCQSLRSHKTQNFEIRLIEDI